MIIHGDATKIPLADNSVDTCITDPPYHLTSIIKRFGKENSAPAKYGTDGVYARASAGFMGKTWDGGDVAFDPATWAEVYRVLKPGALLLSFGSTRTYHRMVCAIEDAGFEIRDTIGWVYGSGFPKSYDISKGIDKKAGAEREVTGISDKQPAGFVRHGRTDEQVFMGVDSNRTPALITAPSTHEAQLWDGWGTALKPAMELIVVAMKPLDGTYVENALKWGVAGMWIDGGRVGTDDKLQSLDGSFSFSGSGGANETGKRIVYRDAGQGRFPANLIHDGSDEVLELFPNDAARFFYTAKASRAERNAGLEGMEKRFTATMGDGIGAREHNKSEPTAWTQNFHPTVKPLKLMQYLVRLTRTPFGGTVIDPFMGSGTTGCACALEGREFIGIEKEAEYIEIAKKRIAYWSMQPKLPVE